MELAYADGQAAVRSVAGSTKQSGSEQRSNLRIEIVAGALKGRLATVGPFREGSNFASACHVLPNKHLAENNDCAKYV